MTGKSSLVERVKDLANESHSPAPDTEMLSKEALEALALSDRYSFIEPEPYILPLDALTGYMNKHK